MPSNVTLVQLRTEIRHRTDHPTTGYVTDAHLNTYINGSIAALHDILIEADPSYFLTQANITVVAGTQSYSLPATFYKVIGHDLLDSSSPTGYTPLERFEWTERHRIGTVTDKRDTLCQVRGNLFWLHPTPTWSGTIQLSFIPVPTALAQDNDSWNSINLWSEWVILDVAVKLGLRSEDEIVGELMAQRRLVEQRILKGPEVNKSRPKTVINVRKRYSERLLRSA